jgi:hypothetical protein
VMDIFTYWCYKQLIKQYHIKKINFLLNKG